MFATHVAGLAVTRSGCGHAQLAAAPVTVPHTHERQEALTTATTHGKKFFVAGGKHIMSDNMFKSAKIVSQNAEAVVGGRTGSGVWSITQGVRPRSPTRLSRKRVG
jgi:hypothetical protein